MNQPEGVAFPKLFVVHLRDALRDLVVAEQAVDYDPVCELVVEALPETLPAVTLAVQHDAVW